MDRGGAAVQEGCAGLDSRGRGQIGAEEIPQGADEVGGRVRGVVLGLGEQVGGGFAWAVAGPAFLVLDHTVFDRGEKGGFVLLHGQGGVNEVDLVTQGDELLLVEAVHQVGALKTHGVGGV